MTGYHNASLPPPVGEVAASTFPRVVAGIDFSPASLAAARWATSHVARRAAAIISYIVPPPQGSWGDDRLDRAELRALRQTTPAVYGGLGAFAATLNVDSARTIVRIGRASHWLNALAANSDASLLILGRRSDSNRRGIGEPNVLERSARRSQASVLVVPEGTTEQPRRIIAAIDESEIAGRVLAVADSLALLHSCPLIVLHVVAPTEGTYDRVVQSRARQRNRIASAASGPQPATTEASERWLADLVQGRQLAANHRIVVAVGEPARETIAAATSFEASLIVLGKRGQDDAPQGSIGSVAREVLTRAPIPVLAVENHPTIGKPMAVLM
jgi:nucleotide-binding universal stress UspA family protein